MKWLIISDNHGGWSQLNTIIENYRDQVELIIHCGDSEFPADDPIWDNVDVVVSGNMDFDPQYFNREVIEHTEGNILVVHGHRNGVNKGYEELLEEAQRLGVKFVFHGHTHKLYAAYVNDILLVNPGSLNHSRGPIPHKTYALLEISADRIQVEFYDEQMNLLADLTQVFERKAND